MIGAACCDRFGGQFPAELVSADGGVGVLVRVDSEPADSKILILDLTVVPGPIR